ncbi:MAG: 50S ribosomal protein L11 methyltransferase, partial [Parvibaculum sp.]
MELARQTLGGTVEFSVAPIDPEINWVARSLEGLAPVIAGGFYVYGSHETGPVPGGLTPMKIDAAQAFGTGHHETTTGCLEAIDKVLKRRKPRHMIDVGTGTGLLAFAALHLWPKAYATASDIDPVAVEVTAENAAINGVPLGDGPGQLALAAAPGMEHPLLIGRAP